MSEKKVVSRRVFIALEIVCIILVACLVGATSLCQLQISDKDNTISSQNSRISNLQSQVNNLTDTLNLFKSTIWVNQSVSQPANSSAKWTFSASYAGYVYVFVGISYSPWNVVIRATYHSYADFDQAVNQTYAFFPILPSTNIQITVSDTTNPNGLNGTVTITYYY